MRRGNSQQRWSISLTFSSNVASDGSLASPIVTTSPTKKYYKGLTQDAGCKSFLRMSDHHYPKTTFWWVPPRGKREPGRHRKTWRQTLKEDLEAINMIWDYVDAFANDQNHWRTAQCVQHGTRWWWWRDANKETLFFKIVAC